MPKKGVNENELLHVAEIARLKLSDEEIKLFSKQIGDVIAWFDKLSEVDTKNVKPSMHPLENVNVAREDSVEECLDTKDVFANTNHKEKGFFKGPRIV